MLMLVSLKVGCQMAPVLEAQHDDDSDTKMLLMGPQNFATTALTHCRCAAGGLSPTDGVADAR